MLLYLLDFCITFALVKMYKIDEEKKRFLIRFIIGKNVSILYGPQKHFISLCF